MSSAVSARNRAAARAFAEGNMTGTVTVRRTPRSAVTFDPDTLEVTVGSGTTIYSGKARVPIINSSGTVSLGEGEIPQRQVNISIPIDAPVPRINDLLTIGSTEDPALAGDTFRVIGVDGGGIFAAVRHLTCTEWFASDTWDGTS